MTTSENDDGNVPNEMSRLAARVDAITERYAPWIEAALDAKDRVAFERLAGEAEAAKADECGKTATFVTVQDKALQSWEWVD